MSLEQDGPHQFPKPTKKELSEFLMGFGAMLPPRNFCGFIGDDDRVIFSQTRTVSTKDINAHVLTKVCGITIHWVDSLSCHLELDTRHGRLFLYRYPSFCLSCLQQSEPCGEEKQPAKSVLHQCALERPNHLTPWATEEDVTGLLREILLSYRLLFGQVKKSRATFRQLPPFAGMLPQTQDKLLKRLCGRKRFDWPDAAKQVEWDEYDLAEDFPHLRSELVRVHIYASKKKPRSIRKLWRDRRDSTAWLAFWSFLVFGSISVTLALLHTVFQVLQYVEQLPHNQI